MGVYTLGFALPFLLTGLFTTSLLRFFKRHKGVLLYTGKIAGVLLILMGILMMTGYMNSITGYLSRISGPEVSTEATEDADIEAMEDAYTEAAEDADTKASEDYDLPPALDFVVSDNLYDRPGWQYIWICAGQHDKRYHGGYHQANIRMNRLTVFGNQSGYS